MTRLSLAFVLSLFLCSPAYADIITIRASDYRIGVDISTIFQGVTLSRLVNQPNTVSVYDPLATAVVISDTQIVEQSIGGAFHNIEEYDRCQRSGNGCNSGYGYNVLELVFDAPTDYVQFTSASWSDPAGAIAYDLLGNRIGSAGGWNDMTPIYDPLYYWQNTVTLAGLEHGIARVVFAGWFTSTRPTEITYNHVPEPSTLLLLTMGALAFVRYRRST